MIFNPRNIIIAIALVGAGTISVPAQSLADLNASKRYEIDAKRQGVDMTREEAVPASREFIRIDSTYYVGWMIQGIFNAERAADYNGYKLAIAPLEKALTLIERDYAAVLRTRTADPLEYVKLYKRHADYSNTANYLFQAYQNLEQNENSYKLLRRIQQWNMQKEIVLNGYNMLSWIVHRNRFYTHRTYDFLKDNLEENEILSDRFLDSSLARIQANQVVNKLVFPESSLQYELQNVYHYKAILHAYHLRIDSALYYFRLMENGGLMSYNNYGTFCAIQAKFSEAEEAYAVASMQDAGDKRLQEWAYYSSIVDIYRGMPMQAAISMRDMIHSVGSTPGFGWYNIALARACSYEGNLAESQRFLDKAAQFKEVHIGTTLGKSHYEFSINLLRLMNKKKEIRRQQFEDKNWGWHPRTLWNIALLKGQAYLQQYLVANQLAANPERENVVYKLFSTESTISWDEIWYLIRGYSTAYFFNKFESQLKADPRPKVYKYFNLYLARLDMEQGHYKQAQERLQRTLSFTEDIEEDYEKLFLARVYEALVICADKNGDDVLWKNSLVGMYRIYPQLLPYAEFKMRFRLKVAGSNNEILSALKKYNIALDERDAALPLVSLNFSAAGDKKSVTYAVTDTDGKRIVPSTTLVINDPDEAVRSIAYGLFKILPLDTQPDVNHGG